MNGVHLGNFALFMNELHRSISQTTWRVTSVFISKPTELTSCHYARHRSGK